MVLIIIELVDTAFGDGEDKQFINIFTNLKFQRAFDFGFFDTIFFISMCKTCAKQSHDNNFLTRSSVECCVNGYTIFFISM